MDHYPVIMPFRSRNLKAQNVNAWHWGLEWNIKGTHKLCHSTFVSSVLIGSQCVDLVCVIKDVDDPTRVYSEFLTKQIMSDCAQYSQFLFVTLELGLNKAK